MDSDRLAATLAETIALFEEMRRRDPAPVVAAARMVADALGRGGKLLVFGNGGSAADAQHVASELVNRLRRERRALAAIALTTDTSVVTSIGNDASFDAVFARQIEALGRPGDVALAISTSGRSPNVVAALAAAARGGLGTIALTGRDGGAAGRAAAVHVKVPSDSTARVQEVHRTLLHVICELVEDELA